MRNISQTRRTNGFFMNRILAAVLVTMALAAASDQAAAQTSHDNDFTVYVPPRMSLRALRPDQSTTHPETVGDVTFRNQLWWATTASSTGSTIRFTTDTCFVNQDRPGYLRDVRLQSPRLFGNPSAGWGFDTPVDQTDYAAGDQQAQVQISGTGPGVALIFLDVTFITGDLATLAGGDYEVTVVGTITAN